MARRTSHVRRVLAAASVAALACVEIPPLQQIGDAGAPDAQADCPGVDLTKDARNCGACGHDCGPGACVDGACRAFVVWEDQTPHRMELVGSHLFWLANGEHVAGLYSRTVGAGSPAVRVPLASATDLAVDGDQLAFASGAGVGLADRLFPAGYEWVSELAGSGVHLTATHLHWTSITNVIARRDRTGVDEDRTIVSLERRPRQLVVTGARIYWSYSDCPVECVTLESAALDGGDRRVHQRGTWGVRHLRALGERPYWIKVGPDAGLYSLDDEGLAVPFPASLPEAQRAAVTTVKTYGDRVWLASAEGFWSCDARGEDLRREPDLGVEPADVAISDPWICFSEYDAGRVMCRAR